MTKRVSMSSKEITLAKTVPCPKCGVWEGKSCVNTQTGEKKHVPHELRLKLAQTPSKKNANEAAEKAKAAKAAVKKSPKEKLTPEQLEVVNTVLDKVDALGRHAEFVGPVSVGPIISTYRFLPLRRTKVAHLEAMAKDFAVALGERAGEAQILVKRMPGESAVGVYVPNKERRYINFRDTIQNVVKFMQQKHESMPIPLNFGEDQIGTPFVENLINCPHLLIAGSTGGGKSTLEHSIIASLAWVMPSNRLKLILSDTKGVEFKHFADLPHLQFPVATTVYDTMKCMQWCLDETQNRLKKIGEADCRNITDFNWKMTDENAKMPYVVLVIDEIADLMGDAVESGEAKLNAKKLSAIVARSRASGIHVIAATQRSDVKVVAGRIKANFPSRLTFRLPSGTDSRTIINTKGAEYLMMKGDMLYYSPNTPDLKRLHAPLTSIADVAAAVQYVRHREEMVRQQATSAVEEHEDDTTTTSIQ